MSPSALNPTAAALTAAGQQAYYDYTAAAAASYPATYQTAAATGIEPYAAAAAVSAGELQAGRAAASHQGGATHTHTSMSGLYCTTRWIMFAKLVSVPVSRTSATHPSTHPRTPLTVCLSLGNVGKKFVVFLLVEYTKIFFINSRSHLRFFSPSWREN